METTKKALVLGATGGIGGATAAALMRHGWQVRGMARNLDKARASGLAGLEWVAGDAMERSDVARAAEGVSLIVHAVNPPNYSNWETLVLPMIDNTVAAARAAGGARVLLPGTIYNFDPAATPVIGSDSKQEPKSRKGAIRKALERRLEEAAPEVPSLILRAGDYFGPGAGAGWFGQVMVMGKGEVRRIVNPARGGGHSFAYLPDVAEAFARLADRPQALRPFERLQFEGIFDDSGMRMIDAVRRVTGRRPAVWRFPWWLVRIAAAFNGFAYELAEIAPYWRNPVRLDNSRLVGLLGAEPHTPLDEAVRASLAEMGCLEAAGGAGVSRVMLA